MGIYLNPGNEEFYNAVRNSKIYVDKTELINTLREEFKIAKDIYVRNADITYNSKADDYIQNEMVSKNIVAFEQNVQKQKEVNSDEGLYDNQKDNTLSLIVKKISQICIQIIQTIVLLISQFISNIL